MPKRVVMISGYTESGKDTMSKYLCEKHGFVRFAFADKLKDKVSKKYKIPRGNLDDSVLKNLPIKTRPVLSNDAYTLNSQLQIFTHFRTMEGVAPTKEDREKENLKVNENNQLCLRGEPLFFTPRALLVHVGSSERVIENDHWINAIIEKRDFDRIAISDWRYKNEYKKVPLSLGDHEVIAVRIDVDTLSNAVDSSERELDDFKHFSGRVKNEKNGFEDFYKQIEEIVVPLFE